MEYDPIKDKLARYIVLFPVLRKLLYIVLDRLLLRQHYVKREIRRYLPSNRETRFYDAGAGFCQYSWFVLRNWQNTRVFATDLKTDYLESFADFLPSTLRKRFCYQDADLQTYIPQNKYDMAIAIDIMEHIEDDVAALDNFRELLNPSGVLIISTPSDTDEAARFTAEHVRPGYNKAELEEKLRDSGFEILKCIHTYGTFGSLAWKLLIQLPLKLAATKHLLPLLLPYYLITYPLAEVLMQLDIRIHNRHGSGILIVAKRE